MSKDLEKTKDYLEEKVKLQISVIGIGNAGNQIIEKAHASGFDVFAINSSLKDLSDAVVNETIPSFIAGDEARGAGKNRDKSKELFKINGKKLFETPKFSDMVEGSDIVFVVASTAGGTCSGIAPVLINLFNQIYPNKIIIFYGIVPKKSDSIMAQNNTVQCMDEINHEKIPYMLADLAYYEDIPNDVAYADIAKHVINSIEVISGKFLHQSTSGMIDENDMRVIVSEPGYMSVYALDKVTPAQVDKASIQSYMIGLIKNSPAAPIQRDEIVKELGVIVNCPEEMMEASKTGNYNELTNYVGVPLSIFENYSVNNAAFGQFIVLMSGMNLPYTRIMECKAKIEEHAEKLKRVKEIDLSADASELDFLNDHKNASKLVNTSKETVDEKNKKSVLDGFFKS